MKAPRHTPRRQAPPGFTRQGSLKAPQLTGYLAGAVGTAALLSAQQSEAAVTVVTFDPAVFDTTTGAGGLAVTVGSFGSLSAYMSSTYGGGTLYFKGVYDNGNNQARFFGNGTVIGNAMNGLRNFA